MVKARAIQCALSRVCGLCGMSMSWGDAFVGSPEEAEANTFQFPPMHPACADVRAGDLPPARGAGARPAAGLLETWAVVVTGGFELERPTSRGGDMRVHFSANAVSDRRTVTPAR